MPRVTSGDVLEIASPHGVLYVHYLGRHAAYGDAVAVSPIIHEHRAPISSELFRNHYVTFYPAGAAVREGLASIVGNLPSPGLPRVMRRPGARTGRKVDTWIIEDGSNEVVKEKLSPRDRELPIAVIWNHELLLQRIAEGWRPESEGA